MSAADIIARLAAALEAAATREAPGSALVSVTADLLTRGADGAIDTQVMRKTRTLLFMRATLTGPAGAPIATANSVHKLEA